MTEVLPDRILLNDTFSYEIPAIGAELYVTVRGTSLFTGAAALTKAKEVAEIVEGFVGAGIASEKILVHNISMSVESGTFTKSSTARYTLKVKSTLEQLPQVLGVVAAAKNAKLDSIDWTYDEDGQLDYDAIENALKVARKKADTIARGIGVRITGVYECSVNPSAQRAGGSYSFGESAAMMSRARVDVDLGMQIAQSLEKELYVSIQFRIEPA